MKYSTKITGLDAIGDLMLTVSAILIAPILSVLCIVHWYVKARWIALVIAIIALIHLAMTAVAIYRIFFQFHVAIDIVETHDKSDKAD